MDWRFDPILLTKKYSKSYHLEKFEMMCEWLHDATTRCIVSFVDAYRGSPFGGLEAEDIEDLAIGGLEGLRANISFRFTAVRKSWI